MNIYYYYNNFVKFLVSTLRIIANYAKFLFSIYCKNFISKTKNMSFFIILDSQRN